MKITILDYGAGNLPSVERAFERLAIQAERATTPESISSAEAIVLPGVGHVAALIRALDTLNLREPLCEAVRRGTPFLGICLGLQVLFASSEEAPELPGLNLLEGEVRALPNSVKLPHMGWNQLECTRESRLLRGLADDAWFYFAHSYAAPDSNPAATASKEQSWANAANFFFESAKHRPHRERNGEREHDVRNQYAREEKQTDAGGHAKTSVKSRASAECPRAKSGRQQAKCDSGERNWDSGGPVVYAKYLVRKRHSPIHERRFFQVNNPVQASGDPIAGAKHVPGNLSLHGVDIVHQRRWRNDAAQIHSCSEQQNA